MGGIIVIHDANNNTDFAERQDLSPRSPIVERRSHEGGGPFSLACRANMLILYLSAHCLNNVKKGRNHPS